MEDEFFGYGEVKVDPIDRSKEENSSNLFEFYKARCDAFQKERESMLNQFTALDISRESWHQVQWENKMRLQEITDLQHELTQVRDELNQANQTIASLEAEMDGFKIQEAEDRKRIQHLLRLTQPTTEEVTFYKDCRPGYTTRFPLQDDFFHTNGMHEMEMDAQAIEKSLQHNVALVEEARNGKMKFRQQVHARTSIKTKSDRVIRTVYLPSEQADSLLLRVQALTKELEQTKQLSDKRIQNLLNSIELSSAEMKKINASHSQEIQRMQNEVEKLQRLLTKTTKDYLVARHQVQTYERNAEEEREKFVEVIRESNREKEQVKARAKLETQSIRETIREEGNVCAEEFRKQAISRERDIHILKEQYAAVQESYGLRIADLQSRLAKLRSRYKSLENRRNMEMEGFSRDIVTMKRHIIKLENLCYGAKLSRNEIQSIRPGQNNVLNSNGLDAEIAHLQKRYTDLATEMSRYYNER